MSEIVLVCDAYPPEIRSAAALMQDLARAWSADGHHVTVLTCQPNHAAEAPPDGERPASPLPERQAESEQLVVLRCRRAPRWRVAYWLRGLTELWLPFRLWRLLRRHRSSADAVLVYTPALPLGLVGAWMKWRWRARFTLNVQDLFPQNAIDLGVLRNPVLIGAYRALERRLYRAADAVTTHSEGNRRMIVDALPELRGRVSVVHNWVDVEGLSSTRSAGRSGLPRRMGGWEGPLSRWFAGVMGPSQRLALLLDLASALRDESGLLFLLVGNGSERPALERRAAEAGLDNVRFEDFVSPDDYPALLRAAKIGVVCLSADNTTPVVPAKLLGYMAAGLPVLGLLHANSDAHAMIAEARCGVSAVSDDSAGCHAAMRELLACRAEWPKMGERAQRYVEERFSVRRCVAALGALALEESRDSSP